MLLAAQESARYYVDLDLFSFFPDLCLVVLQQWLSSGHGEKMV